MMFCRIPSPRAEGYIHFFTLRSEAGLEGILRPAIIKASIVVPSIAPHRRIRSATVTVSVSLNQLHDSGDIDRCSHGARMVLPRSIVDPRGDNE